MTRFSPFFRILAARADQLAFIALAVIGLGFTFDAVTPLSQILGFSITPLTALLLLTTLLWMLTLATAAIHSKLKAVDRPARLALRVPPRMAAPVVAWLALLLASTLLAPDHNGDAVKLYLRLFGGIVIAWAAYDLARTPLRWGLVAKMIALAGLAVSLIGLVEMANVQPVRAWLENFRYGDIYFADVYRVSSTLRHPNTAAMALELTVPLLFAWALTTRSNGLRAALTLGLCASLLTLALTLSRGGVIAFLVALALTGILGFRYREKIWVTGSLAVGSATILAVGFTMILNPSLVVRMTSESGNELWYRAEYEVPTSLEARPNQVVTVLVQVINRGLTVWQSSGSKPVNLSYHLAKFNAAPFADAAIDKSTSDDPIIYSGVRTSLPAEVPPNLSVTLAAQVAAPSDPGDYVIEWDMIQEGVTWFSRKGQPPGTTQLKVQGAPVADVVGSNSRTKEGPPSADASRLRIWLNALQVAVHYPLLGVGPYNFRWYLRDSAVDAGAYHANSAYLEMLADTGLLGFTALIWLIGELTLAAWQAGKSKRLDDTQFRIWWLALVTALLAWFAHGAVDFFYATSTFTGLAVIAGLVLRLRDSPGLDPENPT